MTTRPELKLGSHLLPGLAAVALFAVLAAIILGASFPSPEGFPEGANVTASIGYAMFNIAVSAIDGQTLISSESFLVAFLVIAVVLDAALSGAIMLAKREDGGSPRTLLADGGRRVAETVSALNGSGDGESGTPSRTDPDPDPDADGRNDRQSTAGRDQEPHRDQGPDGGIA
jgi:NADH-quinone oxidoreductase subunit J